MAEAWLILAEEQAAIDGETSTREPARSISEIQALRQTLEGSE